MENILISIVCPVYNSESFLEECILSVINQTDPNWELLLIDDGSTDKSGLICDRFSKSDSRIKTIHKKNNGQMQARIDGIKLSNGSHIMFLDSDDLLKRNAIEEMRSIIKEKPDINACIFNAEVFPKNENSKTLPTIKKGMELMLNDDIIQCTFGDRMFGYLWMYCFGKSILLKAIEKNNPFKNIRYTEDGAFIFGAVSICRYITTTESTLYLYRDNTNSITHGLTEKDRIDRFYVYEYIYGNIFKRQTRFQPSKEVSLILSWSMFSMLEHIDNKPRFKEMFKIARKSFLLKKVCSCVKTKNRQFNLYRLFLMLNFPCIFYRYSHK